MEYWDVLDRDGKRTGECMRRGDAFAPNAFHLVVHAWLVNEKSQYLIQQGALHLDSAPGVWAATGGCAIAGESSESAVIREVQEELGVVLSPDDLIHVDRILNRDQLEDIWLAKVAAATIDGLNLGAEVMDTRWVSAIELQAMLDRGEFFPYSYVRDLLAGPIPRSLSAPT